MTKNPLNPLKKFHRETGTTYFDMAMKTGLHYGSLILIANLPVEKFGNIHLKTYVLLRDKLGIDMLAPVEAEIDVEADKAFEFQTDAVGEVITKEE